jgi:hypothetical protein
LDLTQSNPGAYRVKTSPHVETMQTPIMTVGSESKGHSERWGNFAKNCPPGPSCSMSFCKTPSPLSPPASLVSVPYRTAPSPSDAAPSQRRSLLLPATPALPTPRPPPHGTAAPPHRPLQRRHRPPPPSSPLQCRRQSTRWRGCMSKTLMERPREHECTTLMERPRWRWHKTCRKGTAWDLALAVLLSYVVMADMGLNYCNG